MKKVILAMALMASAWGSFAQKYTPEKYDNVWDRSRDEIRFVQPERWTNIRDVIHLKNRNQLMVELTKVDDYKYLKDLDQLIYKLRDDIKFYQDSLNHLGSGNVTIDYWLKADSGIFTDVSKVRIKRYSPDGEAFIQKKGELAKLKLEQDTVSFTLQIYHDIHENSVSKYPFTYSIRASFFVNNYSDIYKIAEDKDYLNHIIDTMMSTKKEKTVNNPYKFPSTTLFWSYDRDKYSFTRLNGMMKRKLTGNSDLIFNRADKLEITLNMGAGLVRNTLAPMAEASIGWYNMRPAYYTKKFQEDEINTFAGLSVSPYFFFDRHPDGNFYVKDNWFVSLELGGAGDFFGITSPLVTGGVGYLFVQKGDYFKGPTMKAFMNIKLRNGPVISPELIFTGGFKQIFPGITVKLF